MGLLSITMKYIIILRADSRFAPSQWETALLCNDVSHWLGASLESALMFYPSIVFYLWNPNPIIPREYRVFIGLASVYLVSDMTSDAL